MKPWVEYLLQELTINDLADQLEQRLWNKRNNCCSAPVYSRWGDGEFSAMMGLPGENCDNHKYYPDMGKELRIAFHKQFTYGCNFYYGLVPIAVKVFGDDIQKFINSQFIYPAFAPMWVSGNILMEANRSGNIGQFLKTCRSYRMLYVGNSELQQHLEKDRFLNIRNWVEVPQVNCWLYWKEILEEIVFKVFDHRLDMIGFSAGMPSKVFISELKRMFKNRVEVPMIDFGSMWDGYYGLNTRKYHADYNWQEIREKNLNEK